MFLLDKDGVFCDYIQPPTRRDLYLPPERFVGKPFTEIFSLDLVRELERALAAIVRTNTTQEFDYQLETDGALKWYNAKVSPRWDAAGGYTGVTIVARDVTARRRAEQTLEESEQRFRALIEQASDGIGMVDTDGNILTVNRRTSEMFGFREEEILRLNFLDIIEARSIMRLHSESWSQAVLRADEPLTFELQGCRKDGTKFPVEVRLGRLRLPQRTLLLFIARDITERRELEREVLTAAVREQERIGRDLHDGIAQQLTGLSLLAQSLSRQLKNRALAEAETAGDISRGLRDAQAAVHAIVQGTMLLGLSAVDLPAALYSLARQIEERFATPCVFAGQQSVDIDEEVMHQLYFIAQEAATNAAKHAHAQQIVIELQATGFPVTLTIQDDGVGIREDAEDHGWAGLRIMRYRANHSGGELSIERLPDRGTRVRCRLLQGLP